MAQILTAPELESHVLPQCKATLVSFWTLDQVFFVVLGNVMLKELALFEVLDSHEG
jgi:hypothetical protein